MKKALLILLTTLMAGCASNTTPLIRPSENLVSENSMNTVKAKVVINAPIQQVWDIVGTNFENMYKFNPNIEQSYYLEKDESLTGSKRKAINHKGKFIDVEVIEYDTEKFYVKWEILATDAAPIKAGDSYYSLEKDISGNTVLTQVARFKMKVFFLDWIAKRKFPEMFKSELAGIKFLAEEGQSITPKNKKEITKRYANSITLF